MDYLLSMKRQNPELIITVGNSLKFILCSYLLLSRFAPKTGIKKPGVKFCCN